MFFGGTRVQKALRQNYDLHPTAITYNPTRSSCRDFRCVSMYGYGSPDFPLRHIPDTRRVVTISAIDTSGFV